MVPCVVVVVALVVGVLVVRLRVFAWVRDRATGGNLVLLVRTEAAGTTTSSKADLMGCAVALISLTDDCRTANDSRASFSMFTKLSANATRSSLLLELGE